VRTNTAIVILNYKSYQDTITCINSILNSKNEGYTVIVVDNDSRNDSLKHIYDHFTGNVPIQYHNDDFDPATVILLVDNKINSGYAAGNNVGLRVGYKLNFKYLMVLNNDTLFTDNCLAGLISNIKDNVLCTGPLLLKGDNSIDFNCAKSRPKIIDLYILSYFGRWFKTAAWEKRYYYLKRYPGLKEPITVDIISGSCMLFDAELFNNINFFDEDTFLYYEEAIICEKARLNNYILKFDPTVTIIHLGAQTTKKFSYSDFVLRCEYNSALYYLTTYRGLSLAAAKIACSSMLLFIELYRLKGKKKVAAS
jgi:GT2 family glycosyltransferase